MPAREVATKRQLPDGVDWLRAPVDRSRMGGERKAALGRWCPRGQRELACGVKVHGTIQRLWYSITRAVGAHPFASPNFRLIARRKA
jgi:hypothetical protein